MPEALFSIRGLAKDFPGGKRALDGIDLDILEGECLVIAGSNGSGKTVLMRILAGLTERSAGTLRFRGREGGKAERGTVGLVFQDADAQIIGETVAEDVAFGPKNLGYTGTDLELRVDEALAAVGLADKRDAPPRRLSGGEKRRLAVAGILAMGCGTIIMDEPFANLDWPGVVQVLGALRELRKAGKTVVVLTHELEKILAHADRLAILHAGRMRDQGSPGEVLDRLQTEWGIRDPRQRYEGVEGCTWLP